MQPKSCIFTIICNNHLIPLLFPQKITIWSGGIFYIGCYLGCLYCVTVFHFTISTMYFLKTLYPMLVTLYLYVCWCHGLRLRDLNKETTYLLTYLLTCLLTYIKEVVPGRFTCWCRCTIKVKYNYIPVGILWNIFHPRGRESHNICFYPRGKPATLASMPAGSPSPCTSLLCIVYRLFLFLYYHYLSEKKT